VLARPGPAEPVCRLVAILRLRREIGAAAEVLAPVVALGDRVEILPGPPTPGSPRDRAGPSHAAHSRTADHGPAPLHRVSAFASGEFRRWLFERVPLPRFQFLLEVGRQKTGSRRVLGEVDPLLGRLARQRLPFPAAAAPPRRRPSFRAGTVRFRFRRRPAGSRYTRARKASAASPETLVAALTLSLAPLRGRSSAAVGLLASRPGWTSGIGFEQVAYRRNPARCPASARASETRHRASRRPAVGRRGGGEEDPWSGSCFRIAGPTCVLQKRATGGFPR